MEYVNEWDVISKVGYRETLVCSVATKQAALTNLALYKELEKLNPGSYPNLFIRQAR